MLTKPEIEAIVLAVLQAYSGEQWRAVARVEKTLASAVALDVSDAQRARAATWEWRADEARPR